MPWKTPSPSCRIVRELAVHQLRRAHDLAAIGLADRLVAEADAEDRHRRRPPSRSAPGRCRPRSACRARATARSPRAARASASSAEILSLRTTCGSAPELAQIVDEVPGEAVVIVDDEEHGVPADPAGDALGRAGRAGQGIGRPRVSRLEICPFRPLQPTADAHLVAAVDVAELALQIGLLAATTVWRMTR